MLFLMQIFKLVADQKSNARFYNVCLCKLWKGMVYFCSEFSNLHYTQASLNLNFTLVLLALKHFTFQLRIYWSSRMKQFFIPKYFYQAFTLKLKNY